MKPQHHNPVWRYERKFRLANIPYALALQAVRLHPAGFKPAFPDRWINNIYFDDVFMGAINDNFAGVSERQKARLRWYGAVFPDVLPDARLEWKLRYNQLGDKQIKSLSSVPFTSIVALKAYLKTVWLLIDTYQPVLFNRYRRSYFATPSGNIRLTIDWALHFSTPDVALKTKRLNYSVPGGVMELKYAPQNESYAEWVMQHLPFRISKNSKYVTGILGMR